MPTNFYAFQFSSVQSLGRVWLFATPWITAQPGLPVHHQLSEFTKTHVHQVGDAIQPSHPLSSPSPPAPNPSQHQGLFQWVNSSLRWAKYWSFSCSISPSNLGADNSYFFPRKMIINFDGMCSKLELRETAYSSLFRLPYQNTKD